MSLRVRLIATLLVLAAAGLLTLAAVTYATQRHFQLQRIDEQTLSAVRLLEGPRRRIGDDDRGFGRFDGSSHEFGPPGVAATLPPGTYGERRDASGARVGSPIYVSVGLSPPALPQALGDGDLLTVKSSADDGPRYRVRAARSRFDGLLTVVAIPLSGVSDTLDQLLLVEALVIAGVLGLLCILSWVLVRIGLRPLERIGATADAIAGGDLSRRVDTTSPRTEVGRLGLAFNAMLSRLEGAFAEREASEGRLRQFIADASHELRTPLASIRGYAELFRLGAAREPGETEKAMRRIEEEAARMGVLVEDLLTLARLDEVRDRATDLVDVGALAEDSVADARAVDPERLIEAHVDDDVLVLGDPDQLRQVLGNLVRNALVHTPPGTRVEVRARRDAEHAELEVRDHGPGLPTDDGDALFERFWRAEGGRVRGRAGAGLGLAIVAGIVAAHRGEVHARNAPDGGASFVVRIPLAATREAAASLSPG
jgi:two-component system OmpR family sensor kinase